VAEYRQSLKVSARRIVPFAGAYLLAWLVVPVGSTMTWWEYWLSLALVLGAGGLSLVTIADRRYPWLAVAPSALLSLAAIGLLRDSAGGFQSGVGVLAVMPVLQTALYSRSRRDITIVLAGVALFYLVPIWLVGAPGYPQTQYRVVLMAVAVNSIIGLTTQALVSRIRDQARESKVRQRMLEQVSRVVHNLSDSARPRQDVCDASLKIGSSLSAVLYEPAGNSDQLVCVAMAGVKADPGEVLVERRGAAHDVLQTGKPLLITENIEAHVGSIEGWIASGRPSSVLYQPLRRAHVTIGVLIVGWRDHVRADDPRATAIALLAHEAAAVISRADNLTQLSDEAFTDQLTGLPNRRAWERQLENLETDRRQLAIGILDLDHFKEFNDTYGHPAGDRLLKETAAAGRDQIRDGDMLARIGGEEFGILLQDRETCIALEIVERLRHLVSETRTCSAGIAIKQPDEPLEHAVERADAALYQAKSQGRDQSALSDDSSVAAIPR
jgi:diguanylate cyclase (GGDEF)-like protein